MPRDRQIKSVDQVHANKNTELDKWWVSWKIDLSGNTAIAFEKSVKMKKEYSGVEKHNKLEKVDLEDQ